MFGCCSVPEAAEHIRKRDEGKTEKIRVTVFAGIEKTLIAFKKA